jgi:sterol carrier protein 2
LKEPKKHITKSRDEKKDSLITGDMASKPGIPAYVLGVGLTKFLKPRGERAYPELGYEAGVKAMLDAQINYDDVETGIACYCYGDTTSGQRVFYQFGMST